MNKILITGVAGLLGSRLADWIIENKPNVEVWGLDDLSGGYKENVNSKVKFIKVNLVTDAPLVSHVFEAEKFDYVFHFAAYAAEGLSPFIRTYNYDNNLRATALIVNECIKHDVTRLVFTSTLAVYGHGVGGRFDESQVPNPIDPYGVAKYGCEMDIQIAGEQHGLDWCIIRPHNVYGIKQNIWDKYRNVLGIWMYQHLNGEDMTIFGDGEQTRDFTFVDDTVRGFILAMKHKKCIGEVINLGTGYEFTIKETLKIILKISKNKGMVNIEKKRLRPKKSEVDRLLSNNKKAGKILKWKPKYAGKKGFEAALNLTFKWFNIEDNTKFYKTDIYNI